VYGEAACLAAHPNFQRGADLKDPQQLQNNENDGNNEQSVDPTTCLREAWTYIPTEKAEQPQDY
jgi:hypothetical protein